MSAGRILTTILAGFLGAAAGVAAWLIPGSRRIPPDERERRRRLAVNVAGRMGSAIITDIRDGIVCYKYWVGGVAYNAAQDVSALADLLPPDPATLIEGPATLKYLARNPANSIVLCEEWSGLRVRPHANAS